jgi:hypothetical protein
METVIKDSNAIMKMEEDHNTVDGDATVDSGDDATVALRVYTSIDKHQILIEWIYRKWKFFFSSMEDLLDKCPNHGENPIVKSEKAQQLKAILCKTLKSESPTSLHMISKSFGRQQ